MGSSAIAAIELADRTQDLHCKSQKDIPQVRLDVLASCCQRSCTFPDTYRLEGLHDAADFLSHR